MLCLGFRGGDETGSHDVTQDGLKLPALPRRTSHLILPRAGIHWCVHHSQLWWSDAEFSEFLRNNDHINLINTTLPHAVFVYVCVEEMVKIYSLQIKVSGGNRKKKEVKSLCWEQRDREMWVVRLINLLLLLFSVLRTKPGPSICQANSLTTEQYQSPHTSLYSVATLYFSAEMTLPRGPCI